MARWRRARSQEETTIFERKQLKIRSQCNKIGLERSFFATEYGSSSQGMPTAWERFRSWLSDATAAGHIDRRPEEVLRDIEARGPRDIADAALVLKVETNDGLYSVEVPVAPHKLHAILAPIKSIEKKSRSKNL
jgi:hypothetical protein